MSGRLAIFGGTFDPIHHAHLRMARAALEACDLDRILFVPAAYPPHRTRGTYASYDDRYRMVEIACAGRERFEPSRLEAGAGKSYSIDTIERVRAERQPGELYFLIGADAFAEIRSWHRWREVVRATRFIVVGRPGAEYAVPDGAEVTRVDGLDLDISSSEIRRKLASGDADAEVPAGVLAYIREHQLYGSGA